MCRAVSDIPVIWGLLGMWGNSFFSFSTRSEMKLKKSSHLGRDYRKNPPNGKHLKSQSKWKDFWLFSPTETFIIGCDVSVFRVIIQKCFEISSLCYTRGIIQLTPRKDNVRHCPQGPLTGRGDDQRSTILQ